MKTQEKTKRYPTSTEANVRLISAAPDLLEACKFMLESIKKQRHYKKYPIATSRLEDAIGKAERL